MQRFEYRHPRFSVDLPAQFSVANETVAGRCTDISTKGLRLELLHAVAAGACGIVSLRFEDQTVELNARVAHAGAAHGGMELLCESTLEQRRLAHLLASLSAPAHRHLSLVPRADPRRPLTMPGMSRR